MKLPRPFPYYLALLGLLSSTTAYADKLDDWYKLLPKNTVGVIAIKDTPELLNDWDKSSFSKLMQDAEFKKWTAPMIKDGETPWDKAIKENSGEGLYDNMKRYPGASMAVFTGDGPEDFSGDEPPLLALSDASGKEKELTEAMEKEVEMAIKEDDTLKQRSQEVEGVTVHILSDSDDADSGWKKAYAFVDATLVEARNLKDITYMITALKSGAGEGAGLSQGHLERIAALTNGSTDVLLYLNGETVIQWGIDAAMVAAASAENPSPISPEAIIDALGAKELQALAIALDLNDEGSRTEIAVLHTPKPEGFVSILRGTGGAIDFPAFVPADVSGSSVMRYSLVELWDKLLGMVNKLGPMAAMATMQLSGAEAQVGVKIRDDLFGSLDDQYVDISDGSLEKQSQVMAFKVKDHDRLAGALDGVKRFVGAGFAAFEESEYLGFQLSQIKTQSAGAETPDMVFCLTKDYFFFSTGPQALLKKVLSRMKEPSGPSVWDDERVQSLLATLPAGYVSAGVADSGKLMKLMVEAMTMVQSQTAKTAKKKSKGKKGKGPKAADAEEEALAEALAGANETWFDPEATPSDAMWKRYFGILVNSQYQPADAIHFRMISKPVEAQ